MQDEYQLERMRNVLKQNGVQWTEKRMFGGDFFMVDEKMLIGTFKGGLMARVNPEEYQEFLTKEGAALMIHGGKEMKGFISIDPLGYDTDDDLEYWIKKCLEYNPLAKASNKKRK